MYAILNFLRHTFMLTYNIHMHMHFAYIYEYTHILAIFIVTAGVELV